jgi:hypothetical protein
VRITGARTNVHWTGIANARCPRDRQRAYYGEEYYKILNAHGYAYLRAEILDKCPAFAETVKFRSASKQQSIIGTMYLALKMTAE